MELSLDLGVFSLPKNVSNFLREVSRIENSSWKLSEIKDYIDRLEEERRKVDAFKRELPLCMLLLNDAIGRLKEETMLCNAGSVGEELVPSTRNYENGGGTKTENVKKNSMNSTQINLNGDWSESRFHKEVPCLSLEIPISEMDCGVDGSQLKLQRNQKSQQLKKERRCWSPELHRRFVDVLQKLGGSKVATPKMIREMMQVEGLTNDEVKSHLQKYRMHIQKQPSSSPWGDERKHRTSQTNSPQSPLVAARGTSSYGDHSSEAEESEKSDGRSWKLNLFRRQQGIA